MYFTGHVQRQVMCRWTFGLTQYVSTSLSSLHTMTQWHKWAEILDRGGDLGALAISMTEQLPSPSAVCHRATFWRDLPLLHKTQHISVGQSSFHRVIRPCLPQSTHILLCWRHSLGKPPRYSSASCSHGPPVLQRGIGFDSCRILQRKVFTFSF